MALNCIVDDSALVAGIKDGARYNIKEWISQGAVNVFVPLHALERLNILRSAAYPSSRDALAALEWLDSVTEDAELKTAGRVQLQGPDDQYTTWTEVEKYSLPDTPFSSQRDLGYVDNMSRALQSTLKLDGVSEDGPRFSSPPASHTSSALPSPGRKDREFRKQSNSPSGIPLHVQPLINFVVWRSQHKDESLENCAHYLLVTDDPVTQKQAQKFGVRAKLLSQVSGIVARDAGKRKSQGPLTPEAKATQVKQTLEDDDFEVGPDHIPPKEGDEYDDEVLFKGNRGRPSSFDTQNMQTVLDPDSFGRDPSNNVSVAPSRPSKPADGSPRTGPATPGRGTSGNQRRGTNFRGATQSRMTQQGRGSGQAVFHANTNSNSGGRGQPSSRARQSAKIPTGPSASSTKRGAFSPRARAAQPMVTQAPRAPTAANKLIDPDSYVRPHAGRGRGRGNQHKLWDPNAR